MGYGEAKKELLQMMLDYFADARRRKQELIENPSYVEDVLQAGAAKAREKAAQVLHRCRAACGY